MSAMLSLKEIIYTWPKTTRTLGPLSAVIPKGQWVALIGPNGSGKSTLLRLIAAFLKAGQGQVLVSEKAVDSMTPTERARHIAFVPQSLDTNFDLTVSEVVELGRIHQLSWKDRLGFRTASDPKRTERILQDTKTWDLKDRLFTTLSGGEARRTLLAAALIQETPLLLLDEPTAHLDPGHALKFLDLVKEKVDQENLTVLMAYHDLTTVSLYADALWAMDKGQLVLQGTPAEVLHHPLIPQIYDAQLLELAHPRTHQPMLIFP